MLVVHMFQLTGRCGSGGSWWQSVAWSTCFPVWKNMKCCRSNIEVSVPNVGIAVTIPNVAVPVFSGGFCLLAARRMVQKCFVGYNRCAFLDGCFVQRALSLSPKSLQNSN